MPYFRIKDTCTQNGVFVLSGNHRMYGDMSSRVMATVAQMVPDIEIYSIDECFMVLKNIPRNETIDFGRQIVTRVLRNTGIPASMGIATTKTLAKVAARFAKKYPAYHSVCMIDSEEARQKALALTDISDIWGIGRRLSSRLNANGIHTALQLAQISPAKTARLLNVVSQRTINELNGKPCIEMETAPPAKKQICCSRTFGHSITTPEALSEAMAAFVAIATRKLRRQHSCARAITVFVYTNPHRNDLPQYYNSAYRNADEATNDTMTLTALAREALQSIFRSGYAYKRAGILLSDIVDENAVQPSLFVNPESRIRRKKLMYAMDQINNASNTHNSVHLASQAPLDSVVISKQRSRLFSTRINDSIIVFTPNHPIKIT